MGLEKLAPGHTGPARRLVERLGHLVRPGAQRIKLSERFLAGAALPIAYTA
ncbi:hypothetical protein [Streptosporangium vulgare]|uniref:Uncharacterized protein n=1 Tax=Streptosporangium vulgare TaxID=46190 RepID=A0ABV5T930_9ACTN